MTSQEKVEGGLKNLRVTALVEAGAIFFLQEEMNSSSI